jgi:hypothetical protein
MQHTWRSCMLPCHGHVHLPCRGFFITSARAGLLSYPSPRPDTTVRQALGMAGLLPHSWCLVMQASPQASAAPGVLCPGGQPSRAVHVLLITGEHRTPVHGSKQLLRTLTITAHPSLQLAPTRPPHAADPAPPLNKPPACHALCRLHGSCSSVA